MVRYDKVSATAISTVGLKPNLGKFISGEAEAESEYKDPVVGEIKNGRKIVKIDKDNQRKLVSLFLEKLKRIRIGNYDLINSITPDMIIINPDVTLEVLKKITKDETLKNYDQFIKNYYVATIDDTMDEVFGEKVICINEIPYSMVSSQQKPNVVNYDFLN